MRKTREEHDRNEERFLQLSDRDDENKMADAEMAAELQRLQAGEEKRGSNETDDERDPHWTEACEGIAKKM